MLVYIIFHEKNIMNQRLYQLYWTVMVLFLCMAVMLGCSYHRLDTSKRMSFWLRRGTTVRVDNFRNNTHKLGIEDSFKKALENRIVAISPWKLQSDISSEARWIIQATIERYKVRPLSIISYKGFDNVNSLAAVGNASRLDVAITASVRLVDGITGETIVVRPELTFSHQYRVDLNFAGFYNQEMHMLDIMADDFAESFLTQLLEGSS